MNQQQQRRTIFKSFTHLVLFLTFLTSCSHIPNNEEDFKEVAVQGLIKSLKPQLEKVFQEEAPIASPQLNSYPVIKKLPGALFDLNSINQSEITYDKSGNLLLSPGDYIIPVMTYCMKQSGESPDGHIYSLSKISGKRAHIIRGLNLKAAPKFLFQDIQIVSWSLQAGLSYEEMTKESQRIIDEIIPEFRSQLKESLLKTLEKKWNNISDKSRGLLPSFNDGINETLDELGEIGQKIRELREFKSRLDEVGHDYSRLSELIEVTPQKKKKSDTRWSKISKNDYVRFVTDGHFQEIGFVQIRILTEEQVRKISSTSIQKTPVDLASLIANPNSNTIQPLSFTPLYGFAGIVATPALSQHPLAGAALLAAILASQSIDWDTFFDLKDIFEDSKNVQIKKELEKGLEAVRKEHDELEKPLKEAGIISEKDKNTSTKEKNKVREYRRPGGIEQLNNDFDKLSGIHSKAKDGTETKILPDGTTIVKRPDDNSIEVQAPKNDPRYPGDRIKVKVRYL